MKIKFGTSCIMAALIAILLVSGCMAPASQVQQATIRAEVFGNADVSGIGVPGDGNCIALGVMDTIRYLISVFRGDGGTFIMESPQGQFLFAWTIKGNVWGFLGMDANGAQVSEISKFLGSQYSNTLTFTGLVQDLEDHGWQYVTPTAVPPVITATFGTVSAFMSKFGNLLASPIPIILIIPGNQYFNPLPIHKD